MDYGYKYANLSQDEHEIIQKISSLEDEISKKTGQDVVLIAYANPDKSR